MENKGIGINKKMAGAVIFLAVFAAIGIMLACAAPPRKVEIPTSKWGGNFSFSVGEMPDLEKKAPPVNLTIAIVKPEFKTEESILKRPELKGLADGLVKSMTTDIDRVIIAKGMTVKGPFANIEEMTFPDKKATDLTLTPRIILSVTETNTPWNYEQVGFSNEYTMTRTLNWKVSGAFIAFEMREPLSNEKLWVKKLDLESGEVLTGQEKYKAIPTQFKTEQGFAGPYQKPIAYEKVQEIYSQGPDILADAIAKAYPTIIKKFWDYLNTEEMLTLKAKAKELRDQKRY